MELDLAAELAYMEERTNVSAEELIARNINSPEIGVGKALLEMSEFVERQAEHLLEVA